MRQNLVKSIEKLDKLYGDLQVKTIEELEPPSFDTRSDCIGLPPREAFYHTARHTATERYYCSKMHELIHWSGAEKRLNRLPTVYQTNLYAREELVAEAGALILLHKLGCEPKDASHHVTYFNGWLKLVDNEKEALVFARQEAEKAVHYLLTERNKHV